MNGVEKKFENADKAMRHEMHKWGIPILRIALAIVFLWFGALKVFGVSPVVDLIKETYSFMPTHAFVMVLGIWEILIGLGLLFKITLRVTLGLLWLQMLGTLFSLVLAPHMFFSGENIFLLTMEGEFVIKNLVLIASGIVIGGHEVHKM